LNKYATTLHKTINHQETVEFVRISQDKKLLATCGMNNPVRVWSLDTTFDLKCTLEGPSEDMTFLEWHPKGNVLITGGKDKMVWMFNGLNGQYL
jgi:WD40 repeat protein